MTPEATVTAVSPTIARTPAKKAAKPRKKETVKTKFTRLDYQIVHFKKMASEDELPPQAVTILKVLKSSGGKLVASKLVAKLEGHVETRQSLTSIWSYYRARLIDEGYVKIEDTER